MGKEAPEIPEAEDPFGRRVALTIAVMAVLLSVIDVHGDNAKGDGLLAATKASSQWAYYQAKSIKEHAFELQRDTVLAMAATTLDPTRGAELRERWDAQLKRYATEKQEIKQQAEAHEAAVELNGRIDDRCDLAGLLEQIAIVMASVAILVKWRAFYVVSVLLGGAGAAVGVSAFFIQ